MTPVLITHDSARIDQTILSARAVPPDDPSGGTVRLQAFAYPQPEFRILHIAVHGLTLRADVKQDFGGGPPFPCRRSQASQDIAADMAALKQRPLTRHSYRSDNLGRHTDIVQTKNAVQCFKILARRLDAAVQIGRTLASSVGPSLDLGNVASEAGALVDKPFQ
ncbi:hypothetical protein A9K69_20565 [Stenotrophomonas maltophilia]|nr:hypothetical protein A9K69_20565 [Stenotrophomonas maltophilia]